MTTDSLHIEKTNEGYDFDVKVVPNASREEIVGLLGSALKVKVSAAPEAGKANTAVREVIARALKIKSRNVQITAGWTQPHKRVRVIGDWADPDDLAMRLLR
ncbi:MAG: DUF167 domain-containing protein [Phycisphaeraceae bacterium]